MSTAFKRNVGMHTDTAIAEVNVLRALQPYGDGGSGACTSALGYAAFPGYQFKAPQGAAFAVSKILRSMKDRKLIYFNAGPARRGYFITHAGARILLKGQP